MQKINLRELYPDIYKKDTYLEVTDEVQAVFLAAALYITLLQKTKRQLWLLFKAVECLI